MAISIRAEEARIDGELHGLIAWRAKLKAIAGEVYKTMMMARMLSILTQMSDDQLARIGITRSEIASHAAKLVGDE